MLVTNGGKFSGQATSTGATVVVALESAGWRVQLPDADSTSNRTLLAPVKRGLHRNDVERCLRLDDVAVYNVSSIL
jgi:hypothetical protein